MAALDFVLSQEIQPRIALLPEDLRTTVVLRDVQGLSNTEAAEILDISISVLKARLHRGRHAGRVRKAAVWLNGPRCIPKPEIKEGGLRPPLFFVVPEPTPYPLPGSGIS